jgi:amino acid transporter
MAEEVHNPSETLPKVIISSVPIGTLTGVVYLLPILFTLPDVGTMLRGRFNPEITRTFNI